MRQRAAGLAAAETGTHDVAALTCCAIASGNIESSVQLTIVQSRHALCPGGGWSQEISGGVNTP